WRHERRQLIRHPRRAEDPRHRRGLCLGIGGIPLPRADRDLALVAGERLHRATVRRPLPGNELDEPGYERQSLLVVRGTRGIARLPQARQVADHRDRPDAVVAALEAPGRDRRVVDRTVEREVELDVPLQTIDGRTCSADPQIWREPIRYGVRDDIPVARWRLGARAVGPEL